MKVYVVTRSANDAHRPLTKPIVDDLGLGFHWVSRTLAGDVCDPVSDPDGWYKPEPPLLLVRWRAKRARFWSWQVPLGFGWVWRGYAGFKVYGVDLDSYRTMIPSTDIFDGSQAMCLSFRPFQIRKFT